MSDFYIEYKGEKFRIDDMVYCHTSYKECNISKYSIYVIKLL